MAENGKITREDIHLKARVLSEGVRVKGLEMPPFKDLADGGHIPMPDKLNVDDVEEILGYYADAALNEANMANSRFGTPFRLDGCGLQVAVIPNPYSRLDLVVEDDRVTLMDGGEMLATGTIPERPAWQDEKLSNGMPIMAVMPQATAGIINIVYSLSCMNYNTGRGCRYCNLFSNPVSRKIVMLPKETLRAWARYQAEGIRIATDSGWRGTLAVSGGALPPAHRGEYLERLEIVMNEIRKIIDEKTFGELRKIYNHFPPEDFNDMHVWKDLGIDSTSIDLEVMDDAYFAAICPGKNAYKPLPYWKEAQEASVEVFGPYVNSTGCVVTGIEPMSTLLKGFDERLSKGVGPLPLIFGPAPGSDYRGFRPPNADWFLEVTERMGDLFMNHGPKVLKAVVQAGGGTTLNSPQSMMRSSPISLIFDEVQRRLQNLTNGAVGPPSKEEAGT